MIWKQFIRLEKLKFKNFIFDKFIHESKNVFDDIEILTMYQIFYNKKNDFIKSQGIIFYLKKEFFLRFTIENLYLPLFFFFLI